MTKKFLLMITMNSYKRHKYFLCFVYLSILTSLQLSFLDMTLVNLVFFGYFLAKSASLSLFL